MKLWVRSVGMGVKWMGQIAGMHEKSSRSWKERPEGTKGRHLRQEASPR